MNAVWPKLKLGDLAEKIGMGPFGSSIKVETFVDEGIPVISGAHLHGIKLLDRDYRFVSEVHADKLKSANVFRGDVVFTHAGTIGQVVYIPENSQYERYVISQRQFYLRCDRNRLLPEYVTYYFKSHAGRSQLLANASQVGVPSIAQPSSYLKQLAIPVPELREQERIVEVLRALDDKIELNRRLSETLEAIAQALFQSWFVDFDPAPFKVAMRDSTLGREVQRCGGIIQTGPFGSQLHASDYQTDGVPVVMPQDLQSRRVSVERVARVSRTKAGSLDRHRLQVGDVVYSRRGDVERHALISDRETGWLCGTGCLLIRPGKAWPSQAYLSEWLNLLETRTWLKQHAVGATMPNLNTGILAALPIRVPDDSALIAFEDRVNALRTHQSNLSEESESLTELRDALLPRLLSGELAALASIAEEACA